MENIALAVFVCSLFNVSWFLSISAIIQWEKIDKVVFSFGLTCGMVSSVFISGYIFIFVYRKELSDYIHQQRVPKNTEEELEKLRKELLEKATRPIKTQ